MTATQTTRPLPARPAADGLAAARRRDRARAVRRRLAGVVFLLVPVLLAALSVAVHQQAFTPSDTVVVETTTVGKEMHPRAEVKLRGVVVGQVEQITTDGDGARLTLAMEPGSLERVPANVRAQLLPTTLFGLRYVALVPPADPAGEPLRAGAVIPQDRSENAIELEQALDNLLPLFTAVKPEKLSATLTAVATALDGRGEQLGETLVRLDAYLSELNPHLPALNRDLRELVKAGNLYADAAPDIVDALADLTTTTATLAERRSRLNSVYASVTTGSQDLTTFLRQNQENLIRLAAASRPTLETLGRYAPSFPCTLRTLADFVPAMDKALGKGTDRPGLRVDVEVVPSRGAYQPGADTPRYEGGDGPRCYSVPLTSAREGTGTAAPQGGAAPQALNGVPDGLGLANSPQENALVTELLAAPAAQSPAALPEWSTLLAGPVLRGTEVHLK
ncbi:MCE family protein [Streptomyces sp. TRM 70351]|uniref:MCE family protein n=1 Tax=Streptomyces sp. TRM 70351 TaxID=3116552 RepID=UPI002E7B4BB3|nr:MCE family protein [Streptomyces sp. TRM 70351]MEE1927045.1 MCE family protein [Streptomyces sp. TRM 70351]